MNDQSVKVLFVDDDEDDYILVRDLLSEIRSSGYQVEWVRTYEDALEKMKANRCDVCLLDYLLGPRSGVELLTEAMECGMEAPTVLLTGRGDRGVDFEAMKAGASDYLEKADLSPSVLERSIRYAMEHARITRELQDLSRRLMNVHEEERRHLAREMHDTLGSSLVALKFGLEGELSAALKEAGEASRVKRLEGLLRLVQENIQETKRLQKDLRPSVLDDLGIRVAVQALCREHQTRYPAIRLNILLQAQEEDVPEHLKITIYRLLQEGLNNVVKHSGSASAEIRMAKQDNRIELEIADEGRGFDLEHYQESRGAKAMMGITGMKERVKLSGGSFSLLTSPGKGTRIRASWPCKA